MPQIDFGTTGIVTSNSGDFPIETVGAPIFMPVGRICSDGANRCRVVSAYAYLGGYAGADLGRLEIGPGTTPTFDVPAGGPFLLSAGLVAPFLASGGATDFKVYGFNRLYFHRGTNASSLIDDSGTTYAGVFRCGYYYHQPALKPVIGTPVATTDGTSATVSWTAPIDTGETPITGYTAQRATNSAFTTGVQTIARSSVQLSATFTGLTPGATYYYRTTAKNAVSDQAGVLGGQWSDTKTLLQPEPAGLGRQYRGGTFVDNGGKRWSGSTWQNLEGRRWSGSTWLPLGD